MQLINELVDAVSTSTNSSINVSKVPKISPNKSNNNPNKQNTNLSKRTKPELERYPIKMLKLDDPNQSNAIVIKKNGKNSTSKSNKNTADNFSLTSDSKLSSGNKQTNDTHDYISGYICKWFEGENLTCYPFDSFSESDVDVIKGIALRKFPCQDIDKLERSIKERRINDHLVDLYDATNGERLPEEQKKKVFQAGLTYLRDKLRMNNKELDKKRQLDERFYNKYFREKIEELNMSREEFFSTRDEKVSAKNLRTERFTRHKCRIISVTKNN